MNKAALKNAGLSLGMLSRTAGGQFGCNWCSEARDCRSGKKKNDGDNRAHFEAWEC
jgi:hypothetical protein